MVKVQVKRWRAKLRLATVYNNHDEPFVDKTPSPPGTDTTNNPVPTVYLPEVSQGTYSTTNLQRRGGTPEWTILGLPQRRLEPRLPDT